uniref:Uncharacterized protein MANES_08G125600 n=1 Tax=Rhizophora mucronata TaxID=61149 RepID=A0A2P2IKR0_RHIMU
MLTRQREKGRKKPIKRK